MLLEKRSDCINCCCILNMAASEMLFPSSRISFPLGTCYCLSSKTSSTLYRSTLVDHRSGYFCWNIDACTAGVLTMEGEFLLIWLFYISWSTTDKTAK